MNWEETPANHITSLKTWFLLKTSTECLDPCQPTKRQQMDYVHSISRCQEPGHNKTLLYLDQTSSFCFTDTLCFHFMTFLVFTTQLGVVRPYSSLSQLVSQTLYKCDLLLKLGNLCHFLQWGKLWMVLTRHINQTGQDSWILRYSEQLKKKHKCFQKRLEYYALHLW